MIRANPKPVTIRLKSAAYKRLQIAVLERDFFTCQKGVTFKPEEKRCGQHTAAPPHHKIKRSQGGSNTMENLVALCVKCHDKEHR